MIPEYLQQGDYIGIVASARKICKSEIAPALQFFQQQGFRVKLGTHLFADEHQFAGNDTLRAADFQTFLDDDEVKAIICARGGYGSVRLIDRLDFSRFLKSPKWICGYSDVTVFHSHIHNLQVATLHCTMPINIQPESLDSISNLSMIQALTGKPLQYNVAPSALNRAGDATGTLVGGNLSILYSLME